MNELKLISQITLGRRGLVCVVNKSPIILIEYLRCYFCSSLTLTNNGVASAPDLRSLKKNSVFISCL